MPQSVRHDHADMPDGWSTLLRLHMNSADATADFARRLAHILRPGDALLLDGPLGSGKSHFARAAIRALHGDTGDLVEVPSPSFTLVQTYDTERGEVWHADLYRLSDPSEVIELGLEDALNDAIVLIEWPSRWPEGWPDTAVLIRFDAIPEAPDARQLSLFGHPGADLSKRLVARC